MSLTLSVKKKKNNFEFDQIIFTNNLLLSNVKGASKGRGLLLLLLLMSYRVSDSV